MYQQIVAKVKDPEFEATFMKVCNNLNNLNCDSLFTLLKTKFSPANSTKIAPKSGRRVIVVNEQNRRHHNNGFENLLPIILLAGLGNRNRNPINPLLFDDNRKNEFDPLALLLGQQQQPQQIVYPFYPNIPSFNTSSIFG